MKITNPKFAMPYRKKHLECTVVPTEKEREELLRIVELTKAGGKIQGAVAPGDCLSRSLRRRAKYSAEARSCSNPFFAKSIAYQALRTNDSAN